MSRLRTSRCRKANQVVFGTSRIPDYRIDQCDFLISFGANFLETWISNVQFTRQFSAFHEPQARPEEPVRLCRAPAFDDRSQCRPLAVGTCRRRAIRSARAPESGPAATDAAGLERSATFRQTCSAFTPEVVEERTGVKAEILKGIARHFFRAPSGPLRLRKAWAFRTRRPWKRRLPPISSAPSRRAAAALLDFSNPMSLGEIAPASEIKALTRRMAGGKVGALILYRANPVLFPSGFVGIRKGPMRKSLS